MTKAQFRLTTLGARGFSCAVSDFGQVLKSDPLRRSCRPAADETKFPIAREKKPLVPRVPFNVRRSKTSFLKLL